MTSLPGSKVRTNNPSPVTPPALPRTPAGIRPAGSLTRALLQGACFPLGAALGLAPMMISRPARAQQDPPASVSPAEEASEAQALPPAETPPAEQAPEPPPPAPK